MDTTVEFFAPPGQSLTLLVCPHGEYTPANGAGDVATETARAGVYLATVAESLSGWHTAHIVADAGWELPIGDVYMVDGQRCRVHDDAAFIRQLTEAQRTIDQTAEPWQLVLTDRDTGAELARYDLRDANGDGIDSIETFVAEQVTPT